MPRLLPVRFAVVLVMLAACSAPPTIAETQSQAQIQQYKAHVDRLASEEMAGRAPGTAGHDKARDYLVEQFKVIGLSPARITVDGDSYLQPVPVSLGTELEHQTLSAAKDGKPVALGEAGKAFQAQGFGGSDSFDGEAVFVGYSIVSREHDYDSYKGQAADALKGKVAIAFRYEPMDEKGRSRFAAAEAEAGGPRRQWSAAANLVSKALWAQKQGAAALIIVDPPAHDGEVLRGFGRERSQVDIPVLHMTSAAFRSLLKAAGRPADTAALRDLQRRADREPFIQALPSVRIGGKVKITQRQTVAHNVVGMLPGQGTLKDEVVIIGAHYDHLGHGDFGSLAPDERGKIHFGADDNASGVAAMLLVAEQLAAAAKADDTATDRRSVLFAAFTAEERGLIGSRYMASNLDDLGLRDRAVNAMLNLDMVGRLRGDRLHVMGVGTSDRWNPLLKRHAEALELKLHLSEAGAGPSDHTSFYVKSIPVLHFFTGVHGDYHRPADTADKVNHLGGARVAALVSRVTADLQSEAPKLAFKPTDAPRGDAAVGVRRVRLGIMPEYGDDAGGCGVAQVMPDTAAAAAGLKAGDVIERWNDAAVADVMDLTRQLGETEPGDTVTLRIRRDDETIDLKVHFEDD